MHTHIETMSTQLITLIDLHPDEHNEQRPPFIVPLGETVIGREPFLQCAHLGVSRSHAKLTASENGVLFLTSIHKKPTYYQRKDDTVKRRLNENESVSLHDGDMFFMIDADSGYKVHISSCSLEYEEHKEKDASENQENEQDGPAFESVSISLTPAVINKSPGKRKFPSWMEEDKETGTVSASPVKLERCSKRKEIGMKKKKMSGAEEIFTTGNHENRNLGTREEVKQRDAHPDHELSDEENSEFEETEEVQCGKDVPMPTDVHEFENVSEENEQYLEESDTMENIGETGDTGSVTHKTDNNIEQQDTRTPSPVTQTIQRSRPSCRYAESCYRQNPQHRIDFSHPGDADFVSPTTVTTTTLAKPVCPFGTSCYRKNPKHITDYDHTQPPVSSSPTQGSPRKARKKRKAANKKKDAYFESGSEDSYDSSFIDDSSDEYDPNENSDFDV